MHILSGVNLLNSKNNICVDGDDGLLIHDIVRSVHIFNWLKYALYIRGIVA